MPTQPRRHFLPWHAPLLPQAVAHLAGGWSGEQPLDLSRVLVLVPTRQSGRRLREAIAVHAAQRGSAAFPPQVITPESLLRGGADEPTRLERLLAWVQVFREIDLAEYRSVFPVDPPARDFAWALRLGERFHVLQTALAENGLGIADVRAHVGPDFPEMDRWTQLADLERRHVARLADAGRDTSSPAAGASPPIPWSGLQRIVLVGIADPLPAAIHVITKHGGDVPVDVLVFAPPEQGLRFDAWGRPIEAEWSKRVLDLPDFEQRVHLCAGPAEQAARVASLAHAYRNRAEGDVLAVGVADPEILGLIGGEAARKPVAVFNPEGRRRRDSALFHLIVALQALAQAPTYEAVEAVARCPDLLAWLAGRGGAEFSKARFLAGLDDLRRKHLPGDLDSALHHASPRTRPALDAIHELRETLVSTPFPDGITRVLQEVYAHATPDGDAAIALQDMAAAWSATVRECAAAGERLGVADSAELWQIALRLFGESVVPDEKPAGALELQGWLELLFEDAPHLVVAGLNDGFVPEAVTDDPFLPESLRARLGLKTNAARFARDAYLLQSAAACRAEHGRLDVLFGKASAAGDPLRPSRLLLKCPDEELPRRVNFLFSASEAEGSHLPWTRAWRLKPKRHQPPSKIAVTALRRWLACPFRFYLKSVLRMEAVDASKSEMDAFDFGTLCHTAFEAMGNDSGMRDCTDASRIREFLLAVLETEVRARFGSDLPLPLLIQAESARQRLGKVAELQAAERAAGWVIETVERSFAVPVGGLMVSGKIDRIDRHLTTGAVRVLDYKTSDTAVTPQSAHLRAVGRDDTMLPDWAVVSIDDKLRAWVDLQLPLYRHALAAEWGPSIQCGYINVPKAVTQTTLEIWEGQTLAVQAAAMRCAEGVCAAISRGEFWPPDEELRPASDEFASLFHRGVAESVDPGFHAASQPGGAS